jgi:dCMP deaminase
MGYNCFPRGVDDDRPERQSRENGVKYLFFCHSEVNAVANAARVGVPLDGCTVYLPALPCADCVRLMLGAGIREIVCESNIYPKRFEANCRAAEAMLQEAGVLVRLPNTTRSLVWTLGDEWGTAAVRSEAALWSFWAIDSRGDPVADLIEAKDRCDAVDKIKERGLFPIKLKKQVVD